MHSERWQSCTEIFNAALEQPAAERAAFLERSCDGDQALRRKVELLLKYHDKSGDFIQSPAFEAAPELLADDPETLIGRHLGCYRVEAVAGVGGMGVVYLARDERLGRKVALKLLPPSMVANQSELRRLEREARTASALNHPNIVTIHEIGQVDSTHYVATEFVEGETLRERMTKGSIAPDEAMDIAAQVASALGVAHRAGIVHRDIKPENIMLRPDGYVKVLDFGIAKLTQQEMLGAATSQWTTQQGMILGTTRYMSPEQARGQAIDARSDLWSLGVVLYEMLAGRAPFEGETPTDMIAAILRSDPQPLKERVSIVPPALERVVDRCLRKDPAERYQTVEEMLSDLRAIKEKTKGMVARRPKPKKIQQMPAQPAQAKRNNLPAQLSSFIGREREIAEIKQVFADTRLLTLTGAGGCGKTRLALRVAADLLSDYPDGVWLVELAAASDPAMVTRLTAEALGIQEQPKRPLLETLADFLRSRRLLLVVDNCEHLLDACANLADALLKTCSDLQILATSREAIGVAGETIWQVPPLTTPEPTTTMSAERLREFEAVRLFKDRAVAVQPRFALTEATAPAVAKICWRLDGMPLAIELAAARMSALSAAQIAERLQDSFQLLSRGKRTAMPRHQTLKATIDWSYALLRDPEQSLFQRLSVFAGGFDLEAAENICAGEAIKREEILELLTQLIEKSLLLVRQHNGTSRYRVLEPIRQYAHERLHATGTVPMVRRRHLGYFVRVAEETEPRMLGPEQLLASEQLEVEHADLLAALTWAVENDPESALKLANALGWFWEFRGYLAQGREWFRRIVAQSPVGLESLRGEAHVREGRLASWQGEYKEADLLTEEGMRLCERSGNRRWLAMALNNLGGVAAYRGDVYRAEVWLEKSLSVGKEDNDVLWRSLGDLAQVAISRGEYERARELIAEAMASLRRSGVQADTPHEGCRVLQQAMGDIELALGNTDTAATHYEQALAITRKFGNKRAIVGALDGLGKVAFERGDYVNARRFYEQALEVAEELGHKSDYAIVLRIDLAELAAEERKFEEARRLAVSSLRNSREVGDTESTVAALSILAWLRFAADGQAEAAAQLFGAAEGIRESLGMALPPHQRARHERRMTAIRNALGEEVFASAWARGKAMRINETVAHALSPSNQSITRRTARKLDFLIIGILLVIIGIFAYQRFGPAKKIPAAPQLPAKSIAVLPFENRSANQENAFFADGVQDQILTNLAQIADLKVISRTSVMNYRQTTGRKLRQIGQELGVAHLVEGSVQRSGNRVRVNAQLIDARTDAHLWANTYDRDLVDVFAIQSEIAKAIAEQLQAKLSPSEKKAIELRPTNDIAAFDLYTRAKDLILTASMGSSANKADLLHAVELLGQAVSRDPSFFDAYCQLAHAHGLLYSFGRDHTSARLALEEAAVATASRLRPDAGETHLARARNLYRHLDYNGALAELELARQTLPNDARIYELMGFIQRCQKGRYEEATRTLEHAIDLDPRNVATLSQIAAFNYRRLGRHADAKSTWDRLLAIRPNDNDAKAERATVDFDWKADTQPLHQTVDSIRATNPGALQSIADNWLLCALAERDAAAAKNALVAGGEDAIAISNENVFFSRPFIEGVIARMTRDDAAARSAFTAARAEQEKIIQAQPNYGPAVSVLGLIDAGLGRKEEAIHEGRRATELLPVEKNLPHGMDMIKYLAMIAAWAGDKDLACEQLAIATSGPSSLTYGELKLLPLWDPLRGDPRFEKIVASLAPK